MSNQIDAYNNTTSSLEPAQYSIPSPTPAESQELSCAGLAPGSHRFIIGENANPAVLADKIVGNNPRIDGAQAHYMAYAAKKYGPLKPGMIVEFPPSEQIIGHQGPGATQRAARAYEALKQLERKTGTTKLSAEDQARIDAEMCAIQTAQAARTLKLTAAEPMQCEDAVVAPSPLHTARTTPIITRAALDTPQSRSVGLRNHFGTSRSSAIAAALSRTACRFPLG